MSEGGLFARKESNLGCDGDGGRWKERGFERLGGGWGGAWVKASDDDEKPQGGRICGSVAAGLESRGGGE